MKDKKRGSSQTKAPYDSKLHQMDFAINRPCLYDKYKAICIEIHDKILYDA